MASRSEDTLPISPTRFAEAIQDLPLSNLHAKAAELRNSIAHLKSSNSELEKYYAESGDADCATYIAENEVVMERMTERIELLKAEVEGRGMMWVEDEKKDEQVDDATTNGVGEGEVETGGGRGIQNGEADRVQEDEGDGLHL